MAESFRLPNAVTTKEIDLRKVEVVLVCEGIEVGSALAGSKKKNAEVIHKFQEESLSVEAMVTKKNKKVNYKQVIKKLPGKIIPDECTVKYKKDQIILTLVKKEESSWVVQLSSNGLEQASSSDDSD